MSTYSLHTQGFVSIVVLKRLSTSPGDISYAIFTALVYLAWPSLAPGVMASLSVMLWMGGWVVCRLAMQAICVPTQTNPPSSVPCCTYGRCRVLWDMQAEGFAVSIAWALVLLTSWGCTFSCSVTCYYLNFHSVVSIPSLYEHTRGIRNPRGRTRRLGRLPKVCLVCLGHRHQ